MLESNLAWERYKIQCWCLGNWEEIRKIEISSLNIKTCNYSRNNSWLPSLILIFLCLEFLTQFLQRIIGWVPLGIGYLRLLIGFQQIIFPTECFILPLGYTVPLTIWLSRERMHCTSLEIYFSDA